VARHGREGPEEEYLEILVAVEEVLDEGEAEADADGVDDAVGPLVEFWPSEEVAPDEDELDRFLDEAGDQEGLEEYAGQALEAPRDEGGRQRASPRGSRRGRSFR
jgi:hypothetical protein